MKKTLLFSLLAILPLFVLADPVEIDGIYYNLNAETSTAEVTRNPNKYAGVVNIPASVTSEGVTYNVTSIGSYAFNYCGGLSSISLPDGLTCIYEYR